MSNHDNNPGGNIAILLLLFVCLKLAGTSLAAWSWWWIFLPIVPLLAEFIKSLLR